MPPATSRLVTDPLNPRSTTVYESSTGRRHGGCLGDRSTMVYDAGGPIHRRIDTLGDRTTSAYDAAGHVIAVVDPLGNRSTATYDAAGNAVASTDALNHTTTSVYDGSTASRPRSIRSATGPRWCTTPMAASRAGRCQQSSHDVNDDAGRKTSSLDGLEKTWQTVYDAAGNAIAAIDPLGAPDHDGIRCGQPGRRGSMPSATELPVFTMPTAE